MRTTTNYLAVLSLLLLLPSFWSNSAPLFSQSTGIGSITGKTWQDVETDVNGILEPGIDTLLQGITIRLLDGNGVEIDETTSDSAGCYKFDSLSNGSYQVQFLPPDHLAFAPPNMGVSEELDSDVIDLVNGLTDVFFVEEEGGLSGLNAGFRLRTLAVSFRSVNAQWLEDRGGIQLAWYTSGLINTDKFIVHRALGPDNEMLAIAEISLTSTENGKDQFGYFDASLVVEGVYYYQIQEVDYDGLSTFSDIVAVDVKVQLDGISPFVTFPNPTSGEVVARIINQKDELVSFELYDTGGKLLHMWKAQKPGKGQHSVRLTFPPLPEGQYFIRALIGTDNYSHIIQVAGH